MSKKRKSFITLGRTKAEKVLGFFILLYLFYKAIVLSGVMPNADDLADQVISGTYYEVTIPSKWFDDYSQERMIKLLEEFEQSEINKEKISQLKEQLTDIAKKPEVSIELYKDKVDGELDLGWVVRFEVTTEELGFENSQSMVNSIGGGFGDYLKKYKR